MQINAHSAAIDNDFLNHALEIQKLPENDIIGLLENVFRDMGICPIVHPLVYQHEIQKEKKLIKTIFEKNIVQVVRFEDIHRSEDAKKAFYEYAVRELYNKLFGPPFNLNGQNVFTYWQCQSSLGEIHSLAMCLLCGCAMFLSDDKDSKKLQNIMQQYFATSIPVYNRADVVRLLKEKATTIPRIDLRHFSHQRCC